MKTVLHYFALVTVSVLFFSSGIAKAEFLGACYLEVESFHGDVVEMCYESMRFSSCKKYVPIGFKSAKMVDWTENETCRR